MSARTWMDGIVAGICAIAWYFDLEAPTVFAGLFYLARLWG